MKAFGLADRLIGFSVLRALLLTWAVLLGFDAISAFAGELDELGQGDYDVWTALIYTAYTLPRRAYELYPSAAMIGCVLGLGALAASSELTALRAAGLSKLRICAAAIGLVGLLMLAVLGFGETAGPWGEQRAQATELAAKSRDLAVARGASVWAREGDRFLNARHSRVEGSAARQVVVLDEVKLFEFDSDGRLRSLALARRGEHRDGQWTLFDVHRAWFEPRRVRNERVAEQQLDSRLKPELLNLSLQRPRYLSLASLRESLDYLERNRLDSGEFAKAYWSRLFYPLNTLVLALTVLPFVFGTLRSGGFGKRLFLGLMVGLGFFVLNRVVVEIAHVYGLDLRLAHLLPPALLAGLAGWYLRRVY